MLWRFLAPFFEDYSTTRCWGNCVLLPLHVNITCCFTLGLAMILPLFFTKKNERIVMVHWDYIIFFWKKKMIGKLEKTKLPLLNGSSWKLQSWCHAARKEYIIYQLPPWKYIKNFSEVKKSKGLLHFTLILILNCDFSFIFWIFVNLPSVL